MAAAPMRSAFPILRRKTYLNTCSLGAYSTSADRRVKEFYTEWSRIGAPAWYKTWWARLETTRAVFAKLIGADASEIAVMPNVSSALNALASTMEFEDRKNLVTTQLDFPTVPYSFMHKPGVNVRRAGSRNGVTVPLEAVRDHVDESVAALVTSHVFYSTGAIQDVKAVSRLAAKAGAMSIIDSYHAVGQLPVDVRDIGCDVLVSGGLKWLLGGPGCALLYVRKRLLKSLQPSVTGWFANERQFEFDPEGFSFRPTASRFESGTPSLPSTFATLGGMELVSQVGPSRIRRRQNLLVTDLYEKLVDRGFRIASPERASERAGILMVPVPDAPTTVARLAKRNIIVDHRDGKVRVSPYFYNNVRESDEFVAALAQLR